MDRQGAGVPERGLGQLARRRLACSRFVMPASRRASPRLAHEWHLSPASDHSLVPLDAATVSGAGSREMQMRVVAGA